MTPLLHAPDAVAVWPRDTSVGNAGSKPAEMWLGYRTVDRSVTRGIDTLSIFQQIDTIARAAASPDWDGENARAVEPSTIAFAKLFAASLPAQTPAPEISADHDGDISFDWSSGPRRVFSVSVRRDGLLSWAGLFGIRKRNGSDIVFAGLRPAMVQYIHAAADADTPLPD